MVKIPLQAIPNQQFQVVLDGQNCTLHIYQRGDFLYMDVECEGAEIRTGAICLPDISLTNYDSADFSGMLFFIDTLGKGAVPTYEELGDRFILCYATADEVAV